MKEYVVESLVPLGKGKYKLSFAHGLTCNVYSAECKEGFYLLEKDYSKNVR